MKKTQPKSSNIDEVAIEKPLPMKKSHKKLFKYAIYGVIFGGLAIFFLRVAIWEHYYYSEKEGSQRTPAITLDSSEETEHAELDESEVTETQRAEYYVAADLPRYLSIEKLGVKNARVLALGTLANGELATPASIFDVGWYTKSGKPGQGGTLLIDGHNGGPNVEGVFKHLDALFEGDRIVIERGDGELFTYVVKENTTVSLDDADAYMATAMRTPVPGVESLTLITCTGEWSQVRQTYLSRQFVRAILVNE